MALEGGEGLEHERTAHLQQQQSRHGFAVEQLCHGRLLLSRVVCTVDATVSRHLQPHNNGQQGTKKSEQATLNFLFEPGCLQFSNSIGQTQYIHGNTCA